MDKKADLAPLEARDKKAEKEAKKAAAAAKRAAKAAGKEKATELDASKISLSDIVDVSDEAGVDDGIVTSLARKFLPPIARELCGLAKSKSCLTNM